MTGLIVGVIIRYGLDAEKHMYILDCKHDKLNTNESLPSSVVVSYKTDTDNNTEYYEYTNGKKLSNFNAGQPQFEDKVVMAISVVL